MGDKRRFNLFADLIVKHFPPAYYHNIADVAAGKGHLQLALRERGYKNVISFDKRKRKFRVRKAGIKQDYHYRWFDSRVKQNFDLIVALHPDEATDHVIVEAGKGRIPFVLCPCCVKPDAVTYWGSYKFEEWVNHLKRLALKDNFEIQEIYLKMQGRNLVLIGKPH